MPKYIYVSDVFCPWCYGYGLVFAKIRALYPFAVQVFAGELVPERCTLAERVQERPTMPEGLERVARTTGRSLGSAFYELLKPGAKTMYMDSPFMAQPLEALKVLQPGQEVEQLELLQKTFYEEGQDVTLLETQCHVATSLGIEAKQYCEIVNSPRIQQSARESMAKADALLGEFLIYPTLFLEDDHGSLQLIARGYTSFEQSLSRLEKALAATISKEEETWGEGCGPQGCLLR